MLAREPYTYVLTERYIRYIRNCVWVLSTDLHAILLTGPYIGVPKLCAPSPAVLEIWRRHPTRAQVQIRPRLTFHATLLTGLYIAVPWSRHIYPLVYIYVLHDCTKFERNQLSHLKIVLWVRHVLPNF